MPTAVRRQAAPRFREPVPTALVAELIEIADYITHMREAIAALRPNEMSRARIPMAHEELGSVVAATAGATNTIMEAAEAMLGLPDGPGYRAGVEARINTIFEACAFQDITGQRIAKVVEALQLFEGRLGRFVGAVKARDAADIDPAEQARRDRAQDLLLNGPQAVTETPSQDDIDALFA
ncbi:protein phosphatase CheZ [Methylobacterium sp. NEAU 140]|uniref:protein phosphatase CheZ n=1 Tax=Methylobacterium sp. NEAU 140 TaxID=3064945 RepID=UPI002732E68E|nr:protein phosphatase CheZ [Methylobacterium sp. NEAU 140]MDP4026215.1 protein phosphatase CheZ [Methylobacterium sp. NEAU 140]